MLSRGTSPDDIIANKKWLHGPKWLLQPRVDWPKPKFTLSENAHSEILSEQKQKKHVLCIYTAISHGKNLLLYRYSNFDKILRITTYVFRFIHRCRVKRNTGEPRLPYVNYDNIELPTEDERKKARDFWIINAQEKAFKLEIECIESGDNQYPAKSKIVALRPMIGKDGLLRASGRIGKANRTEDQNRPIIIPPKTRLTFLLLDEAHQQTGLGGTQAMMAYLRNAYWIPCLRRECKTFRSRCIRCIRQSNHTVQQIMRDLPAVRVRPTRPFKFTGVDLAGPFNLRLSDKNTHNTRARKNDEPLKGYVVIFVCMATRAVHLDLVTALTSEKFLEAYDRFTSRRGLPETLFSDNGTNFVGANNIMQKTADTWSDDIASQVKATWKNQCVQQHINHGNTFYTTR